MSENSIGKQALDFQLELLKAELKSIDEIIARLDGMAQSTKNWSIVTWAGGVAILLQSADMRYFIGITMFLPMLFWYLDAQFRRIQGRTIYRQRKIHDWANSSDVAHSFKEGKLHNLIVLDPTGNQYRNTKEYMKVVSQGLVYELA